MSDKIYIKIDGHWFDVTMFTKHPGGTNVLKKNHMKDCTEAFNSIKNHNDTHTDKYLKKYEITDKTLITDLEKNLSNIK